MAAPFTTRTTASTTVHDTVHEWGSNSATINRDWGPPGPSGRPRYNRLTTTRDNSSKPRYNVKGVMGIVRLKDKPPPRVVRIISKDPRPIGWRMPPTPSRGKSMNPATGTPFYTEAARQSLQQADHERALQMRMNRYYAMARSSDPTTKEAGERGVAEVQALQSARYAKMSRGVDGVANPEVAINLQRHNINSDPVFGAVGGPSVPGTPRGRQAAALVQQARFGAISEYLRGEDDRNSLFRSRVDRLGPGDEDEFDYGDAADDYGDAGPDIPPGQPRGRWVQRLPDTVRAERLPPTIRQKRDAPGVHESRFGNLGDTSRQLQRQLRTDETEEQDRGDARARRPSVTFAGDIPNQEEIARQMGEWFERNRGRAEGWQEEEEEEEEPLVPAPARAPDSPNTAQRKKDEREAADARHAEVMRSHAQHARELYEAERKSRGLPPLAQVEAERLARWKEKEAKRTEAAKATEAVKAAEAAGETPAPTANEASGPEAQVMVDSNGPPELAVPVPQPTLAAAALPAVQAVEEEESKYPQAAAPQGPSPADQPGRFALANTFYLDESLLMDNAHGRNSEQAREMIEDYRRYASQTADHLASTLGRMLVRRQESPVDDEVYKPLIEQIGPDVYRYIVSGIEEAVKAKAELFLKNRIDGWVKNGSAPMKAVTPATIVGDEIRKAIYGVTATVATTAEPAALFGYDNPTPAQVQAIHGLLELSPPLIADAVEQAETSDILRANQYAWDNDKYRWAKHRDPLFITPRPAEDPAGAEVRLPPVAARQPPTPQAPATPPRVESPPKTPKATTPQRAASPLADASPSSTLSDPRSQASSRRSSVQSVRADPLLDQSGFATPPVNRPLSAHSSPAAREIAGRMQAEQEKPAEAADEGWSDRGDSDEEYVDLDNRIKRDYYRKLAVAYNTYDLNNNVWSVGAPAKVTDANNKSAMSKLLSEMAKAIKGLNPEDRAAQATYTQKNIKRALRDKSVRDQLAGLQGADLKQKAKLAVGRYHKKKPGAAPDAADKPAVEAPKKKLPAKQSAQASKNTRSNLAFLKQALPTEELAVSEGPVANALVQAGAAAAKGTLNQFFENELSFARSSPEEFISDRAADKAKVEQDRAYWHVISSTKTERGRKLRAGLSAILNDSDNNQSDEIDSEVISAVQDMLAVKQWRQLFSQIRRAQVVMGNDSYGPATRQAYNKSLGATLQGHMPADNDALTQIQTGPTRSWLFPLLAAGLKAASFEGNVETAQATMAGAVITILSQLSFPMMSDDPSVWPVEIIQHARGVRNFLIKSPQEQRVSAHLFNRVAQAYRKDSDSPEKPRPILSEQSSGPQLEVPAAPQVSVPVNADARRALLEARLQKGIQQTGMIRTLSYVNSNSPGSPPRPPSSLDLRGPPSVIGQNLSSAVLDAQVDAAYQVADEQKTMDALRTHQAAAAAKTRSVMRRDAFMGFTGEEPAFESFMRQPRDQQAARRESGRLSSSPSSRRSSLSSEGPEPSDFLLANYPFSGDRSFGSDSDGTSNRRSRPLSHLGPALRGKPRRAQQGSGEEDMLPPAPRRSLGLPPADVVAQLGTYELPLYDRSEMKSNSVSTSNLFTRTAYYPNDQKTNSMTPKLTVQLGAVSDPNTRFNAKRKVRPPLGWASIDDGPASKMARRGF